MTNDIVFVKYGVGFGLSIYVIKELFRIVTLLIQYTKSKKEPSQESIRDESRKKIESTDRNVKELMSMRNDFYTVKNQFSSVHSIITERSEGVPLIYNKGLEKSIAILNSNVVTLSKSIDNLAKTK